MADYKEHVDALASLMEEFRLSEAAFTSGEFHISFQRFAKKRTVEEPVTQDLVQGDSEGSPVQYAAPEPVKPKGLPINSPMNGIFYNSPSPSAPPFVKIGDEVTAGQVIGLIEAMKVFNEIPSPISGVVVEMPVTSGTVVQPGETLLLIG